MEIQVYSRPVHTSWKYVKHLSFFSTSSIFMSSSTAHMYLPIRPSAVLLLLVLRCFLFHLFFRWNACSRASSTGNMVVFLLTCCAFVKGVTKEMTKQRNGASTWRRRRCDLWHALIPRAVSSRCSDNMLKLVWMARYFIIPAVKSVMRLTIWELQQFKQPSRGTKERVQKEQV